MPAIGRNRRVTACEARIADGAIDGTTQAIASPEKEPLIPIRRQRKPQLEFVLRRDVAGHLAVLREMSRNPWTTPRTVETAVWHVHDTG